MVKDVDIEISKEKYEEYCQMNISVLNNMIEQKIPKEWICGYGWYGCRPLYVQGKYILRHRLGTSCD